MGFRFREYSFLERAPQPGSYSTAQLVFVSPDGGRTDREWGFAPKAPKIQLSAHFSSSQARNTVSANGDPDVLWVTDLSKAKGVIDVPEASAQFERRMHHVAGVWCCQGAKGGYSYTPMLLAAS